MCAKFNLGKGTLGGPKLPTEAILSDPPPMRTEKFVHGRSESPVELRLDQIVHGRRWLRRSPCSWNCVPTCARPMCQRRTCPEGEAEWMSPEWRRMWASSRSSTWRPGCGTTSHGGRRLASPNRADRQSPRLPRSSPQRDGLMTKPDNPKPGPDDFPNLAFFQIQIYAQTSHDPDDCEPIRTRGGQYPRYLRDLRMT